MPGTTTLEIIFAVEICSRISFFLVIFFAAILLLGTSLEEDKAGCLW